MSFRLIPKSVTLNDLNGVMTVILRYFTEFLYDVVVKQLRQFCKAVTGLATFSARIVIYLMLIRRAGT